MTNKMSLLILGMLIGQLIFTACGETSSNSTTKAIERNKSLSLDDFKEDSDDDVNYKEEEDRGQFQKRNGKWRWQDKGVQEKQSGKWDYEVCEGSEVTARDDSGRAWGWENGKSCKIVE